MVPACDLSGRLTRLATCQLAECDGAVRELIILPLELLPGVVSGVGDRLNVLILWVRLDPPVHGQDLRLGLGLHPPHVHDDEQQ